MSIKEFYNGETVVFSSEIRSTSTNELFDPTSVELKITKLRRIASDLFIEKVNDVMDNVSVGIYSYNWTSDDTGSYEVVFKATDGTLITIEKLKFKIK
ncbi:MAG TPA: hypothetical protein DDW27_12635 [Bacteroidales bacterium]|nr:hypothetical protein [Bacteroidales bacterium]